MKYFLVINTIWSHQVLIVCYIQLFITGVPWDITEAGLAGAFKPFGNVRIEWPGKDNAAVPKGYLYIIFEHEKQVSAIIAVRVSMCFRF